MAVVVIPNEFSISQKQVMQVQPIARIAIFSATSAKRCKKCFRKVHSLRFVLHYAAKLHWDYLRLIFRLSIAFWLRMETSIALRKYCSIARKQGRAWKVSQTICKPTNRFRKSTRLSWRIESFQGKMQHVQFFICEMTSFWGPKESCDGTAVSIDPGSLQNGIFLDFLEHSVPSGLQRNGR